MRIDFNVEGKHRSRLECPGLVLESALVDDASPKTLVMVYRIEPISQAQPTGRSIVKFSSIERAIPNAKCLQLGTHRYYREYDGAGSGIKDDMEGRFSEDITDALLRQTSHLGQLGSFSAQATFSVHDQWVFCTSVLPAGSADSTTRDLGEKLGYQCGTLILDPAAFAQELGIVFAANSTSADVRLVGLQKILSSLASMSDLSRTVFVYHGPVSYPIDAAKLIRSFPELHQPALVPFQKRPEFSWQREYRFAIGILGEPENKTLSLPISKGLRCLSTVVWEK